MSIDEHVGRASPARRKSGRSSQGGGECAVPPRPANGEETGHCALMAALSDAGRASALLSKVCFVARARYGILPQDAEDIFNESVATYLVIHGRYPPNDNHFGLLVGIFHKKSLEFLDGQERLGRVARRFVARLQSDRPELARGEDPGGPVVDRVVRDEDAGLIRAAIHSLSPQARELLLTLAEGRMTRLEMIQSLGVNRNTFDTRLRSMRLRLMRTLADAGVIEE